MIRAEVIVRRLLETDDDLSPLDIVRHGTEQIHADKERIQRDYYAGKITAETAPMATEFYHRTLRYKRRGKPTNEPLVARRNGQTKTWKTRPGEFRVPVKYGMYEYFYIDHTNAHEWSTQPHPSPES